MRSLSGVFSCVIQDEDMIDSLIKVIINKRRNVIYKLNEIYQGQHDYECENTLYTRYNSLFVSSFMY